MNMKQNESNRSSQYLMQKIQQIIPDLRQQVARSMKNQLRIQNNQKLTRKREQLKQRYSEQIDNQMTTIHRTIKDKLLHLQTQIHISKQKGKTNKKKALSKQQGQQLVSSTVEKILADPDMVRQVKNKLTPSVRQKVQMMLQFRINQVVDQEQEIMEQENCQHRQLWVEERQEYWRKFSKNQLQQLAEEYRQLECKKDLIEESLQSKKLEREAVRKKLKEVMDKNSQTVRIKKQIKRFQAEVF